MHLAIPLNQITHTQHTNKTYFIVLLLLTIFSYASENEAHKFFTSCPPELQELIHDTIIKNEHGNRLDELPDVSLLQGSIRNHPAKPLAVTFNHDGTLLAASCGHLLLNTWNTRTWQQEDLFILQRDLSLEQPRFLIFNHNGTKIAAADGKNINLFNTQTFFNGISRDIEREMGNITCLAFSHNGRLLAAGSDYSNIYIWNLQGNMNFHTIKLGYERAGNVYSIAFNRAGTRIIAGFDKTWLDKETVHVWNLRTRQREHRFYGQIDRINSLAACNGTTQVASIVDDDIHISGMSKGILRNHFLRSKNPKEHYLFWLLAHYKNHLQSEYPKRKAIRIQDVAEYAGQLGLKRDSTVAALTDIAKNMPVDVRKALIKTFAVYSCTNQKMNTLLTKIRENSVSNRTFRYLSAINQEMMPYIQHQPA
jgi:WD40 repeat protein